MVEVDVEAEQELDELELSDGGPRVRVARPVDTAHLNYTDIGNGERLAVHGRTWLRHVHAVGWHIWDTRRWLRDVSETYVVELAKYAVRGIYAEQAWLSEQAALATDADERQQWSTRADAAGRHARASEHAARVAAMIKMAYAEHEIIVRGEDGHDAAERLDADPNLLNLQNGTLDLDGMVLREHDPADLITKVSPASYDSGATAPRWAEFLEMVLPDPEVRGYVQRAVGYSLLGSFSEFLFIPHGDGLNGKSTFLRALRDVLGEYAASLPAELLTPRRGGMDAGAYSALASMRGVRMVTTVETEQGRELSESFVKELTGEGVLQAKFMRQDMFEFHNKTAVWLATNHLPLVRGTDFAIWRRLRLIPFEVTIPAERREDPIVVEERFRAERDGILQWALAGLRRYREVGLDMPPAVMEATAAWQREMDPTSEWIEECCEFGAEHSTPVAVVRASYEEHARAAGRGDYLLSPRRLNDRLRRLGCEQTQVKLLGTNTKAWRGVKVRRPIASTPSPLVNY